MVAAIDRTKWHRHDPIWQHDALPLYEMGTLVPVVEDPLVTSRLVAVLVAPIDKSDAILQRHRVEPA